MKSLELILMLKKNGYYAIQNPSPALTSSYICVNTIMLIERRESDQVVITVSSKVDSFGLKRVIDYLKYLEATASSKAKQSEVDKLADVVNESWWRKNKKRFIKQKTL